MIPLYRTSRMESAANILIHRVRRVLVRAAYDNHVRIRFRADSLRDPRVFFGKVPSQRKKWQEKGGALISWRNDNREGEHEAIVLVECPKTIEVLYRAIKPTLMVGVVYVPPSWNPHEEQIEWRYRKRPVWKKERALERLAIVREFVEQLPPFTRERLAHLLRARLAQPQSSSLSSPGSPASAAHSPNKTC